MGLEGMWVLTDRGMSGIFKGGFVKGWFWQMCPRSGCSYRRSVFCTLVPLFGTVVPFFGTLVPVGGVQGTSTKPPFWKPPFANPRRLTDVEIHIQNMRQRDPGTSSPTQSSGRRAQWQRVTPLQNEIAPKGFYLQNEN